MRKIYVESLVRAPLAAVWEHTQDPAQHQRWDLRFARISYLPRAGEHEPQRFRYATAGIDGVGVSTAQRVGPDGATSSLRFASAHPLSVIEEGAGYWRYVPTDRGTRFLTGYHYQPRYRLLDVAFGPLMGWATAWSFDRLRLWLETGVTPESALRRAVVDVAVRLTLAGLALLLHPFLVPAVLALGWVLPAAPGVPSARRCLRRPPDPRAATPPADLERLARA